MRLLIFLQFVVTTFLAGLSSQAAPVVPLVEAARAGNEKELRLLLSKAAEVDESTADGTTALHWAVHRDEEELIDLLLEHGADAAIANRYGVQPLTLAALNGSVPAIERLLVAGAVPDTVMPGGETVLMTAARGGTPGAVKLLLEHGADPNARVEVTGQTALMWAAAKNNASAIASLVDHGADLAIRTPMHESAPVRSYFSSPQATGFTALLFAVRAGQLDATRALLDAGADVNDTVSDGQSALVVAAANANWELASYLLERGADPALSGAGWNALHQVIRTRRPNPSGGTPGPIPTGSVDSIDLVKRLIASEININARMSRNGMKDGQRSRLNRLGATAFFLAAKNTDVEAMQALLDGGADPLVASADGTTPLMVAAGIAIFIPGEDGGSLPGQEAEVLEAVRLCLDRGTDVNAVNDRGETALHGAAFRGVNAVVDLLVARGARLDSSTVEGWTPLALANGLSYSDFYKSQSHTADHLRALMEARGLPTDGHGVDPAVCLDCFQTRPDQIRAARDRDEQMAQELEAGQR